jgi:DNA-binding NtrC family response regulator
MKKDHDAAHGRRAAVVHPVLSTAPRALPLGDARLTDRQRIAVVLEGAALLSILERAGRGLAGGWGEAGVAGGRLCLPAHAVSAGRRPGLAQGLLRELLLRLFGSARPAPAAGEVNGAIPADCSDSSDPSDPSDPAAPACSAERADDGGQGRAELSSAAGAVAGRGEARRAARALLEQWWQVLVPVPADLAVEQILAAAPFLWGPAFAAARQALAGEIQGADGGPIAWVAGASARRDRLLAAHGNAAEVAARLAGPSARTWWDLARREESAGRTEAARLAASAALAVHGRFVAALAALGPSRSPAARLQRARCHLQVGRLGAARLLLRRLEEQPLAAAAAIEAAETALRVFANSGEPERLPRWVDRALAAGRSLPRAVGAAAPWRARAHLVAALGAWDRQVPEAMDQHLASARAALSDDPADAPGMAQAWWRYHHACGLRAMAAANGKEVVVHLAQALRRGRRGLARHEAAGLWNDLGIGRVQQGDLAGAERAFLHAQRLFAGCDGPRRATLALHNLAEVRLRRGRIAGVREILARSTAENRRDGNLRGLTQDAELLARYHLVLGQPAEVIAICRQAMERLDRRRFAWRREVLALFLARALGWQGLAAEAAVQLAASTPAALAELEPEERPAVWAAAGQPAQALRTALALESPAAPLWRAVLGEETPPDIAWEALDAIEPYRAARLVFDLERAAAGAGFAPDRWRRAAIVTLRQVGAGAMADWLAACAAGPWEALARYAAQPAGDPRAAALLVRRAGGAGAQLLWRAASPPMAPRALVTAGAVSAGSLGGGANGNDSGGAVDGFAPAAGLAREEETGSAAPDPALTADLPGGRLELLCRQVDPALKACFALVARDLQMASAPAPAMNQSRLQDPALAGAEPARGRSIHEFGPTPRVEGGSPFRAAAPPEHEIAEVSRRERAGRAGTLQTAAAILGSSPAMRAAMERLERVAAADIPVLIRGESGTGKELAARQIHRASQRASAPFLAVNCAAVAESLLLSDLFGHVRGAFTGADRERAGVFETARGGTVLLDEIGDLPLAAQGLLLRVLQEGEVRRLGESLPRRVDVRVLAATHRPLEQAVAAGGFRQDLFYRLKVGAVDLPPLRDRGDDLLELVDELLSRQPYRPVRRLSPAALKRLRRHPWPGNVRELENVLRLASALATGGTIQPVHLDLPAAAAAASPAASYHQQVEALRRRLVGEAIAQCGGRHADAARRLGISRQALSYLVRQLGLRS